LCGLLRNATGRLLNILKAQYISLSGYSDGTEANNRCVITNKSPRVTGLRSSQILPRYNNGLMGWRFNFVGTEGASILNLTDANTKITVSSANTDVSAKYGAATSDGARRLRLRLQQLMWSSCC
jgi:hypothetical protein